MIAAAQIKSSLMALGYLSGEILEGYQFAAVNEPGKPVRESLLAAFFDSPPSYRNAAFGVIEEPSEAAAKAAVDAQVALGAPFMLVLGRERVSAWTYARDGASKMDEAPASEWDSFSAKHAAHWSAASVRRLKSVQVRKLEARQATLFDPRILYTIQVQVQTALDELLRAFVTAFQTGARRLQQRLLLPLAFRLLAAKILFDRGDARVSEVDKGDVKAVVDIVNKLYSLEPLNLAWAGPIRKQLERSWIALLSGVYVRNIAADDLAFVYENTLIDPDTRKEFGTHSTPSAVAEYIVRSFSLPEGRDLEDLCVYEPFAGSCVFLTAAMRRFKELLPSQWPAERLHEHLVSHFSASEIDQFACEIARLALILADYPMANGWRVANEDLFTGDTLSRRLDSAQVVMCNPPFEDFERVKANCSIHKPIAALEAMLTRRPPYLGIVMPPGLESHKKYKSSIESLTDKYRDVELLHIPEGSFKHAGVAATILIAQGPRPQHSLVRLRRSLVSRGERARFEQTLEPSTIETAEVDVRTAPGLIGLRPLQDVWAYILSYPVLGHFARIHRGLEWKSGHQASASSPRPFKGGRRGLHRAEALYQYRVKAAAYLDCSPGSLRGNTAMERPWQAPKVVCNAIRRSRLPWRLTAAVDEAGLVLSQQFFGIWLNEDSPYTLLGIASALNSPLANAFSFVHDPEKGLRIDVMAALPLPEKDVGQEIATLILEYMHATVAGESGLFAAQSSRDASDVLMEIDAAVLAAYDLPPKMEKTLLKYMNIGGKRPCGHAFDPYPGTEGQGAIPLRLQILHSRGNQATLADWREILAPLPDSVADILNEG